MFDALQLFSDDQALVADAYSTSAVAVNKTPHDGVDIEICVTAGATVDPILVRVLAKSADSAWDYTNETQKIGQVNFVAPTTAAPQRKVIHVQTKLAYLKLHYDGTGWGTATVTAGIVSGQQRDMGA